MADTVWWSRPPTVEGYEKITGQKDWESQKFVPGSKPSPHIIGADDYCKYEQRTASELQDTPPVLVDVEVKYLLPIAQLLGQYIGITCVQEAQYGNIVPQIRETSVFVVLNVMRPQIQEGVATYHGLVVMCKKHPIVRVVTKCQLSTGKFGISQVHLWNKDVSKPNGGVYHLHGDRVGKKPMAYHTVVPLIMEYLENHERVLHKA